MQDERIENRNQEMREQKKIERNQGQTRREGEWKTRRGWTRGEKENQRDDETSNGMNERIHQTQEKNARRPEPKSRISIQEKTRMATITVAILIISGLHCNHRSCDSSLVSFIIHWKGDDVSVSVSFCLFSLRVSFFLSLFLSFRSFSLTAHLLKTRRKGQTSCWWWTWWWGTRISSVSFSLTYD